MADLRAAILESNDVDIEDIPIKQWGVTVRVKSMTSGERIACQMAARMEDGELDYEIMYPMIIINCCFDPETDEKIFTTADVGALKKKNGAIMEMLATKGMSLSGMDQAAADRVGGNS